MHCNVGHGRSRLYLNGTELSIHWTKDYNLTGVPYLSFGSHPNISSSNYSPDMSVYLVRIIQGEMGHQEITTMHADLLNEVCWGLKIWSMMIQSSPSLLLISGMWIGHIMFHSIASILHLGVVGTPKGLTVP